MAVVARPGEDQPVLMAAQRGREEGRLVQPEGRVVRALRVGQDVDVAIGARPGQDQAAPVVA